MKTLILGGKGMAGHMLVSFFKTKPEYDVYYTSRDLLDEEGLYLDVRDSKSVENLIDGLKPDLIINCVGILNQHAEMNPKLAFHVNSLLPHQLAKLAERHKGKLIHISTDCVFSGDKGSYTEHDKPDGNTVYSQSKQLGEIIDDKHLTIRTSIIGPEIKNTGIGLLLWFMNQHGVVKGYKKALWNGVTTLELAKAADALIKAKVTGLFHLGAAEKISKHDLLLLIQKVYQKYNVTVIPDCEISLDRTIKSTRNDIFYTVPGYEEMLNELKNWVILNEKSS
ncbi:SDR family oxidoreductase [Cytobacillus firmus]|uniref:dTDP-4-dehydrorhamnose reductase family protein n=1 Tax=Cytobacillus firmus TaxID=1399 RepID=UPI001C98952C|nr:SDR family oxidoreductase [Cytobacillus firmus]MBY6053355.1 SDR family oxidoreductase [Cytobacillus firmus]USK41232.1 SDR family oxidoreductase [Cytobacillus firmus]